MKIKKGEESIIGKGSPFLYDRNYYGIGYLGNYKSVKNFTNVELEILKRKWKAMLKRCYSKDPYYEQYYKDIFVVSEWHCFENFLRDVRFLPQYHLAKEDNFKNWDLDKDYYSSNMYSKDTCVFLTSEDNKMYRNSKPIKAIYPNGDIELIINLKEFCNNHNLNYGNAHTVLTNNGRNHTHNYKFEYVDDDNTYRYELSRNQINCLIKNIKENPYSRRNMISFWNWANIDKKALVECAYETIWSVRGEYLDMMLVQRSGDMITASGAGCINEVQYAAFLLMIAKTTGYKPGKFTHVIANEQIYDRHIDAFKELKRRYADNLSLSNYYNNKTSPAFDNKVRMNFNPKSNNFYDFTIDDFELINYEPIKPQLKFELGI